MFRHTTVRPRMRLVGLTVAALAGTAAVVAPPASAGGSELGERSLVEVLDADGNTFDKNWNDFDIVHRAATAVLEEKPGSAVGVLADGSTALTAFIPNDRAFRRLVAQLTGEQPSKEKATFEAVAGLGADTVEAVLLYHVVPGATITYAQAKKSDGAPLTTAAGDPVEVAVRGSRVWLVDLDEDDRNPRVLMNARDINAGNKQIAHGISRVLRPSDLP
jgi:Fasciclin domain